jgi:hypothetical protein
MRYEMGIVAMFALLASVRFALAFAWLRSRRR